MARSQEKSKRKASGGRLRPARSKRKYELAGYVAQTRLGERRTRNKRTLGGNSKAKLLAENMINVIDGKTKKATKTEIVTVVENPANEHLVRRNILTKGAIVETKLGKARITSRPGQEGTINGVLL